MKKENLSTVIYNARTKKGISQRELSRISDVDNAEISRIEKGTRIKPGIITLRKLSLTLDLDFVTLLKLAEYTEEDIEIFGGMEKVNFEEVYFKPFERFYDYSRVVNNLRVLDVIKVLKGYKKNDIDESEVLGLLSIHLGIDMKNYIFEDQKETYCNNQTIHTKYDENE